MSRRSVLNHVLFPQFEGFSKFVGWDSPSRRDPEGGRTIGDDLCRLLRKRAGFRKLPNKKFPEGVEVSI